jgi:hypothetical protein
VSGKEYENKVREERNLLEKIMMYIPGYKGYKEKELRRESDRLVRQEAINRLKTTKNTFRRKFVNPNVTSKFSSDDAWRFNTYTSRLDRIIQRLDRAVAGYAGIFDAIKVKEDKLDAVVQQDLGLIERADSLLDKVNKIIIINVGTDDWRKEMDDLISSVDGLGLFFDERTNILKGLSKGLN